MKKYILILIFFSIGSLLSQETKQEQTSPEPLELPNFIIQGNLQLNVNSGIKQNPEKSKPLSKSELDSLNSLEKQSSQSLPIEPLVVSTSDRQRRDSYIKGEFGRFSTGAIEAGYGTNISNYELYAQGGFETSEGAFKNADYSKFNLKLSSDFIAPEKFFLFGGSRTRTQVAYNNNAYKLYGSALALDRTINNFLAKVDVDGNYNGFQFHTGAGFNGYQIVTDGFQNADNNILGYLKINNNWNNFVAAANLLLDLHTLRGQATNFIQADGSLSLLNDDISITGNAGLQWATNSNGIDRGGLLISGLLEYRMSKLFTIRADIRSGLENTRFRDLAISNPYISNMANFDYAYDIMNLGGKIIFHPNEYIGLSGGVRIRKTDRFPIFANDSLYYEGSFALNYEDISQLKLEFEGYLYISPSDRLIAKLDISESSLSNYSGKSVPYIPSMILSASFSKNWTEELGSEFGIDYVDERFTDIQNTNTINSYINLRAEGNYHVYDGIRAFVKFDNLLNSEVYVWDTYRERNIFVTLGLMWQF